MSNLSRIALVACAWAAIATPALAADVPFIPAPAPVPVAMSAWYLRGDIGYTNQQVDSLDNALYDSYDSVENISKDFDGAPYAGIGIGYRVNQWFRTDATVEYRSKSDFDGLDLGFIGVDIVPDEYSAEKSEWVAMWNAYIDLYTWRGITPFIGAGIGASRNTIHGFTDVGTTVGSVAFGDTESEWNLAWALYAGLGFEVTPAFTIELAYRYLDLGDAQSGDLIAFDGTNTIDNPMIFEDLTSHDVRLGFRYLFQ